MNSRTPLLFACHRIPYPPNKGDKIRSFNILKKLSEKYDVYLCAFVDDQHDWQYQDVLRKYCKELKLVGLNPTIEKIKSLSAFIKGVPISLPYFYSREIQAWVDTVVSDKDIKHAFIYSSSMAQYVEHHTRMNRVADFVDVDSDKWQQYAETCANPIMKRVYEREHKLLATYEKKITLAFDKVTFVSEQEAEFFHKRFPDKANISIGAFPNGVETEFFDSNKVSSNPVQGDYIVFTGAMDYWANADAVLWFVDEVWSDLKREFGELKFVIVGGNPTEKVKALASQKGIVVTGRVEDIRPYIANAKFAVAPLRIARGIQNKVLEAMAMGKSVAMTSMAAEGIDLPLEQRNKIADESAAFKIICKNLLLDTAQCQALGETNRKWIIDKYQWNAVLSVLEQLFDEEGLKECIG